MKQSLKNWSFQIYSFRIFLLVSASMKAFSLSHIFSYQVPHNSDFSHVHSSNQNPTFESLCYWMLLTHFHFCAGWLKWISVGYSISGFTLSHDEGGSVLECASTAGSLPLVERLSIKKYGCLDCNNIASLLPNTWTTGSILSQSTFGHITRPLE